MVIANIDKELLSMFRNVYEVLHKNLDPKSIPQVPYYREYVQGAFVADQEINMLLV